MLPLFLSTILGLTLDLSAAPHPGFQEPAQPLEAPVLIYGERQIPASEVLKRLDDASDGVAHERARAFGAGARREPMTADTTRREREVRH